MMNLNKKQTTLLLVDDSPTDLAALCCALKDYHLLTATNALDALNIAVLQQPDLILLAINLPGMDGYEICRRLKKHISIQLIPVIFITHLTDEESETKGFSVGAVDFISKPIRPAIIQARVAVQLHFKTLHDQLALTAHTDALTGIPNRRHFEAVMQNEWSHALRYRKPLSLLIADVDYFKQFNDYYGHAAGDECLIAIANTLNSTLRRATDMVARIGGEEFVCLLPEVSKKNAVLLGDRILSNVRDLAIAHANSSIANHVTISLGLAVLDINHHSSWQALLSQADQALYRAKFEGRNRLIG